MAGEPPELIVCEDCGCLNERATALLDQVKGDLKRAEQDLVGKRRQIDRLKAERWEKLKASKRYPQAMEVLRHWQEVCAPNAKEIDSADRLGAVLARLNGGHTVEQLKLCATGYGMFPFVTDKGRASQGSQSQWHADAELIYRTPKHVQTGIALAARAAESPATFSGSIERLSWRAVKRANRQYILRVLRETYGTRGLETESFAGGYSYWEFPCPRCLELGDDDWSLKVFPDDFGDRIVECWRCGLDEARLIAAITEE